MFLDTVDVLLVTANAIANGIKQLFNPRQPIVVVGNPSTIEWQDAPKNTDVPTTRYLVAGNDTRPILLYIGGYGIEYNNALLLFLESCPVMKKYFCVVFSPHPKVNATAEKILFEEKNCSEIRILDTTVPTMNATVVSQVIVTRVSTVAVKGLFMARPAIYFDEPTTNFTDVAIVSGLIPQVTNSNDFVNELFTLESENFQFDTKRLISAGIPLNGIPIILSEILTK